MKLIMPLAGKGTRLRPHTHTKPKPLLEVAGKTVLGHILDRFVNLNPEEVVFITGEMGDQIKEYITHHYNFNTSYFKQDPQLGDAHAISFAKERMTGELFVVFNDSIFKANIYAVKNLPADVDGCIWVKEVKDPRRFGVVILDQNNFVTKIIEKPEHPSSNLAIIGLYYFKDGAVLGDYIDKIIKNNTSSKGEYRLADTIQLMIKDGMKIKAMPADVWADCGKPETILNTQKWLLSEGNTLKQEAENSVISDPVYIAKGVKIKNSIIGPDVSIAKNTVIIDSIITNSIIGKEAFVKHAKLEGSLIGDHAEVVGKPIKLNLGDNSEVSFE